MKQFYYADGQSHMGPFTIAQLKDTKISKDTLVWFEGIDHWVRAAEVEELKDLFKAMPPPLPVAPPPIRKPTEYSRASSNEPRSYKKIVIAGIAIVALLIVGSFSFYKPGTNNTDTTTDEELQETDAWNNFEGNLKPGNTSTNLPVQRANYTPPPKPREKTAEELRAELYQKEKKRPMQYLSETHTLSYRVFSGKDQISGDIYNSATMATFKDIVLTLVYTTNTGTELGRENFTVYKYCYPGSSTSYLIRTHTPDGTRRIGVAVSGALAE